MAKIPEQIGKYKILSILGSGGSSIVYLGLHPTLKRKVVLKKLNLRGKKSFRERFLQEAALMMDLNHDHIVKVYDHFKEGSRHYMVMEFVEGASLDQLIEKSGPLQRETIRYVLSCCCRALSYIHSRNIIHRDIKPSNIFISRSGEVKLGDFGIALMGQSGEEESGEGHAIMGTPSYMAPEQFNPHGRITAMTDIYALGVSYYELLTGGKLFYGETFEELRDAVLKGKHVSLLSVLQQYGYSSWKIIRRSTFRSAVLRYKKSDSVLRALKGFRINEPQAIEDLRQRTVESGSSGRNRSGSLQRSLSLAELVGQKNSLPTRSAVILVLVLLVLIVASAAFWKSGAFYRLLFPRHYAPLSITISSEPGSDVFSLESLTLYRGDEQEGQIIHKKDLKGDGISYRRAGHYRLMTRWGNRVEWNSFYLAPFSEGKPLREIVLTPPPRISQPVEFSLKVRDALTGEPINTDGALYIRQSGGDWLLFSPGSMIFSGNSYEFRLSRQGFYESLFTRDLEFYENELFQEEELHPLPGKLIIHHNLDRLVLKVNGRRSLGGGVPEGGRNRFGNLDLEGEEWLMAPGVYKLGWSGSFPGETHKLTVRSGEIVVYRISSDKDGKPVFGMDRREMVSSPAAE